jgi:hypothetical protein
MLDHSKSKIDPTARIEYGAVIGEGTSIGPYCFATSATLGGHCDRRFCFHRRAVGGASVHADRAQVMVDGVIARAQVEHLLPAHKLPG